MGYSGCMYNFAATNFAARQCQRCWPLKFATSLDKPCVIRQIRAKACSCS